MRIGFTGTQMGMNALQLQTFVEVLDMLEVSQFHHGMCIGADEQAEELVRANCDGVAIHGHPPTNKSKMSRNCRPDFLWPEADYLVRNHQIVDNVNLLIAAPLQSDEELRSGTWATVRYAYKRHCAIRIIRPK